MEVAEAAVGEQRPECSNAIEKERARKKQNSNEKIEKSTKRGKNIKESTGIEDEAASMLEISIDSDIESSETNARLRRETKKLFQDFRCPPHNEEVLNT